jgi:hypothetical protein
VLIGAYSRAVAGNFASLAISGNSALTGTLTVGGTAAVTGVATFTAMPVLNGGLDVNEDIDIDFDAADEEIAITTSVNPDSAAGAGLITVFDSEDANGANSAYLLRLARKNDGGANNEFILCQDNSTGAAGNGDTKFSVSDAGNVVVAGTLGVTGVATFTAVPKLTATTAAAAVTATATNAPALVAAASPLWLTVTIGSENYVVPAYQLDD